MSTRTTLKTLVAGFAILALPMSVMAGAGHIWSAQEKNKQERSMSPNSAVEQNTRNWAQLDFDGDKRISATEIQEYLSGKAAATGFDHSELPVGLSGLGDQGPRTLSSTELGMHFAHGPGKDDASGKVFIPGATYTEVVPKETSNNKDFNKRAMVLEVQEAMLEKEDKAM